MSTSSNRSWVLPVSITGVVLAILGLAYWFVFGHWIDITARQWKWFTQVAIERWFMPDGFFSVAHWTDNAYFMTGVFVAIGAFVLRQVITENWVSIVGGVVAGILIVISVATWIGDLNDHSAAYADGTVFVVNDLDDMPVSLRLLEEKATAQSDTCDKLAQEDMPGCIQQGNMADFDWEARTASLAGAEIRIKRSSSGNNRTQLLSDTLSYTYGSEGEGAWTAIRDGSSKEPVYGVLTYDGSGDPTTCEFDGEYELNKAFNGRWGRNLSDEIADRYTNLFYDDSDRWAYCDDGQPIIVIPVKEQISFRHRTAMRAAGVLTITGSSSGQPVFTHVTDVKQGDFPGPVYPASLAAEQRESMGMISGFGNSVFRSFGYEPVNESTQDGNDSEYLLRNKTDGRVYWVTPLKQRSGDNQRIVAYSIIAADSVVSGELNQLRVYVLNDDDPRVASLSDMDASVRDAMNIKRPSFFDEGTGGYLAEFLPLDDKTWQVYAELNGRVVYRIVVPVDVDIKPTIYEINPIDSEEEGENPTLSACVEDLKSLDDVNLAKCLGDVADEFESRQAS